MGVGVTVGGSVPYLHSLYTKAFQKDWGESCPKIHTSTLFKDDEPRAEGQRGRSGRPTNRQLHNHKVPLYASKYNTYFPKYAT